MFKKKTHIFTFQRLPRVLPTRFRGVLHDERLLVVVEEEDRDGGGGEEEEVLRGGGGRDQAGDGGEDLGVEAAKKR